MICMLFTFIILIKEKVEKANFWMSVILQIVSFFQNESTATMEEQTFQRLISCWAINKLNKF